MHKAAEESAALYFLMAAASTAYICVGAGRGLIFSRVYNIYVAEDGFKFVTSALRAFYQLLFPLAHFCHYVELILTFCAAQVIKRHLKITLLKIINHVAF